MIAFPGPFQKPNPPLSKTPCLKRSSQMATASFLAPVLPALNASTRNSNISVKALGSLGRMIVTIRGILFFVFISFQMGAMISLYFALFDELGLFGFESE